MFLSLRIKGEMNVPEENPRRVLANKFSDEAARLLHSDTAISKMQCLQIQCPFVYAYKYWLSIM